MLILIETDLGKITLDVCLGAYLGVTQLSSKDFTVKEISLAGLSVIGTTLQDEILIPFGSVAFVRRVSELSGVQLPKPLNIPESLISKAGRRIWACHRSKLKSFPCFIKPLEEVKLFTGFVAKSEVDLTCTKELEDWDGMLWCSEVIPEIKSEWRCYVNNGEVVNCSVYAGEALAFPDVAVINSLVAGYEKAPVGYALDVAVTSQGTIVIECNDAWALGYYGGNPANYFNLVKDRWLEILAEQANYTQYMS